MLDRTLQRVMELGDEGGSWSRDRAVTIVEAKSIMDLERKKES